MQINDTVTYRENGVDHTATVLGVRELDHHLGEDGEPLLHLGFFNPQPGLLGTQRQPELAQFRLDVVHLSHKFDLDAARPGLLGTQRQPELAQFRLDVVHLSHKFDLDAARAGLRGIYPGGRWFKAETSTALTISGIGSPEEIS